MSGVNIIPVTEDGALAEIELKSIEVEKQAIWEIVRIVNACFVKHSRWTEQAGNDKLIFTIKENLEYDDFNFEERETDWVCVLHAGNKCGILKLKETDK
jgi:hypothetical protein